MPRRSDSPGFRDSSSPNSVTRNSQASENYQRHSNRPRDQIRSLCIRNIHDKIPDSHVTSFIEKEFSSFGEFNISITAFNNNRVAYINFK